MKKLIPLLMIFGCSTVPEHPPVVLKSTWVHCWNVCGKGDRLAAVSTNACICSNGGVIPFQAQVPEAMKPEPGFLDKLIAFIKGE